MAVYILGIESSCDDTSAAVALDNKILANVLASQKMHEKYGGVVPELASRAHQQNIVPVVETAIKEAGITKEQINAVAFTNGPGLLGSLLVGTSFAKGFALGMNIPLIEINHLNAHILANFIQPLSDTSNSLKNNKVPPFPFMCLTVSGGHTQIEVVTDYFNCEIIGKTIDDAAGEAFDKTAKILGLPYPGGPHIDRLAKSGNPHAFKFSLPRIPKLDFSYSGLKTSILYFIRDNLKNNPSFIEENINDLCASVQYSIISILMNKLEKAAKETGINHISISGGVSANSGLRETLMKLSEKHKWEIYIPKFEYCTDNAAMVAIAGYYKYLRKEFSGFDSQPFSR